MMRILITAVIVLLALVAGASEVSAQYLFFSPKDGCASDGMDCWMYYSAYHVFLRAPEVPNLIGASFRIESDVLGPEDFGEVIPAEDIVVDSGDVFSGITISWPSGAYTSGELLDIPFEHKPPYSFGNDVVLTRDIRLFTATGDTLHLDDFRFYCSHCHGYEASVYWTHPDTVDAPVGTPVTIDVTAWGTSAGSWATTDISVRDERGWVTACTSCNVLCLCAPCPWDDQHVYLDVLVPPGTQDGDVYKVSLIPTGPCCLEDSTAIYIRPLVPTPTESSSWGRLKSLFRKK